MESVILPAGQTERLIHDAEWFFGAAGWYAERGVPYRRGYLLSGPPGTGKSSIVLALASELSKPVYALNLSSVASDAAIMEAFAEAPADAILLVEDIDAMRITKSRVETKKDGQPSSIALTTLSGLLNAIDGVAAPEGRLLVMTSNHPERLDPALIRPGRIDLHERFELLGPAEVRRMFLRFHPGETAAADRFADLVGGPISPAELQCMLLAGDPFAGVDLVDSDVGETGNIPAAAE
jgi:chaperone BCS1